MARRFPAATDTFTAWQRQELQRAPIRIIGARDNYVRVIFSTPFVKMLVGGRWPKFHGFGFDQIDHWELEQDGTLLPIAGSYNDEPEDPPEKDLAPGPSFKLSISMIDDVFHDPPKVTRINQT